MAEITIPGYTVVRKIGSGSFGDIYIVRRSSDGIEHAAKVIDLSGASATEEEDIQNEVKMLQRLHHQGVLKFISSIHDARELKLIIVTELCPGGDLEKHVSRLPGKRLATVVVLGVCCRVLQALRYLHLEGIIHRDLKVHDIRKGSIVR